MMRIWKEKEEKDNSRSSNFELLRIISMLMIVISHYSYHNGIDKSLLPLGANRFILEGATVGKIGVVIFMLISGWFLGSSKQERIRISKVLKLLIQIITYSVSIYILMVLLGFENFSLKNSITSFLPTISGLYWFSTVYVVIYIFHPYINKFLRSLTKRQYLGFILLSVFMFSIIKTFTGKDLNVGEAAPFLTYYAIGNYLRIYKDNYFSKKKNRLISTIISVTAIILSIITIDILSQKFNGIGKYSTRFLHLNDSIFVIMIAVPIFCALAYRKEFHNRIINKIASTTFAVYLIHDNRFIRQALWGSLFHNTEFVNSSLLIPHMLGAVLCVFVGCSIIEYIRINTLERAYVSLLAPRIDKIQENIGRKIAAKIPE